MCKRNNYVYVRYLNEFFDLPLCVVSESRSVMRADIAGTKKRRGQRVVQLFSLVFTEYTKINTMLYTAELSVPYPRYLDMHMRYG